jgi:hypothetical protein
VAWVAVIQATQTYEKTGCHIVLLTRKSLSQAKITKERRRNMKNQAKHTTMSSTAFERLLRDIAVFMAEATKRERQARQRRSK